MPNTSATGSSVRHAVARALATANQAPFEATYKVLSARYRPKRGGQRGAAEVTLAIRAPEPLTRWERSQLEGWVNPDGEHPMMTLVPLPDPLFVDVYPVTWAWWLEHASGSLPDHLDPLCPRHDAGFEEARDWALELGKRLPTSAELRALWGPERFPWGDRRKPALGHAEAPRFGHVHEVGAFPPIRGLWDLGAWLWHWTSEGTVSGVEGRFDQPAQAVEGPIGFRAVQDPALPG